MQELQILPCDQCFAAFGGFPDSDTKQNSGSTVRTRQSQVLLSRISIHLPAVARVRTRAHHFWMDV